SHYGVGLQAPADVNGLAPCGYSIGSSKELSVTNTAEVLEAANDFTPNSTAPRQQPQGWGPAFRPTAQWCPAPFSRNHQPRIPLAARAAPSTANTTPVSQNDRCLVKTATAQKTSASSSPRWPRSIQVTFS